MWAPSTSFPRLFAWSGAFVFALSLVYFLFSYIVVFGRPSSGGDSTAAATWNVALFTAFAAHHSVFARERVRGWVARVVPAGLERAFYVWVASLLFIAVCLLWRPVPGVAWSADGMLLWLLRLLQLAGVWLTARSGAMLGLRELAGLTVRTAGDVEFRASGPYGWVRHPIYTGWFLIVLAASPMTMTRLVFAAVSCAYLLVAIPLEERSLRGAPGAGYERYTRQVPWKLLPGVY